MVDIVIFINISDQNDSQHSFNHGFTWNSGMGTSALASLKWRVKPHHGHFFGFLVCKTRAGEMRCWSEHWGVRDPDDFTWEAWPKSDRRAGETATCTFLRLRDNCSCILPSSCFHSFSPNSSRDWAVRAAFHDDPFINKVFHVISQKYLTNSLEFLWRVIIEHPS